MTGTFWTSQRLFLAAVAATAVLALFPARWPPARWMASLGEVVRLPMRPIEEGGRRLALWLRPPRGEFDQFDPEARQRIEALTQELELTEALYAQSQGRIMELEQMLRELNQPQAMLGSGVSMIVASIRHEARITGTSTNPAIEAVDLRAGSRDGVKLGTVAVFGGVHLVGRIRRVWPLGSELVALSHPSTGLMRAVVMPRSRPDAAPDEGIVVQLRPVGDGTFVGDVRAEDRLSAEDVVRLDDTRWPGTAQMMVIGHVESIEEKIDQPLRRTVIVRPRYRLNDLSRVVLKIEPPEQEP
jgi:cell shape-determining protein MreC